MLDGYTYFVEKVRDNQKKKMNLTEAIDDAIEDCIKNHILEEFFRNRKDEVRKVTHLDYTWEKREKLIRKEEYEDGKAEGRAEGRAEGLAEGKAEGLAEGRAEGKAEGLAEGLEKGKAEGVQSERLNIARKMLASGLDVDTVVQLTGVSKEDLL